jgi:peptidoglycan/LPS O-acetylase OafA/YrhL
MRNAARESLGALTGARFFAAFWVLIYHYIVQFQYAALPGKSDSPIALPRGLGAILLQGHLAVDFFFLLSGFILAYTYTTPEGVFRGTRRQFWVARVARIYPVYLLGLILALPDYLNVQPNRWLVAVSGVAHLFMIHAWLPFTLDWNQPAWSLGVEAFFYALFPVVLPRLARLDRRGLWLAVAGSWLAFMALDGSLALVAHQGYETLPGFRDIVRYNPLVSFPEFVAGAALGLLFTRYGFEALPPLRRLASPASPAFDALIAGALILFGVMIGVADRLGVHGATVDTLAPFSLPLLAGIILLLAFQRGWIARALGLPFIVWLGEVSYAIYILHKAVWTLLYQPLWAALRAVSLALTGREPGNLALFLAFAVVVITIAGLSFRFLERPLRRWIRARWGGPAAPPDLFGAHPQPVASREARSR